MAWLEQHRGSGHFHLCFRWNGKRKRQSLATGDARAAEAARLRFEENVAPLERGRLDLPTNADVMTFLPSDGKLAHSPKSAAAPVKTLREVVDLYLAALGNGSVEANSLETVRLHLNHVRRTFGDGFPRGQHPRFRFEVGLPDQGDPQPVVVLFLDPRADVVGRQTVTLRPQVVTEDDHPFDQHSAVGGREVGGHALSPRLVLPVSLRSHPGDRAVLAQVRALQLLVVDRSSRLGRGELDHPAGQPPDLFGKGSDFEAGELFQDRVVLRGEIGQSLADGKVRLDQTVFGGRG